MSRRVRGLGAAALVALLVGVVAVSVARADAVRVKAFVPFEFIVGDETLPPGDYVFLLHDPAAPNFLVVQREGAPDVRARLTAGEAAPRPVDKSQIVFDKLDGKYYLAEVWAAGRDEARVVLDSKIRKEEGRVASAVTVRGER